MLFSMPYSFSYVIRIINYLGVPYREKGPSDVKRFLCTGMVPKAWNRPVGRPNVIWEHWDIV